MPVPLLAFLGACVYGDPEAHYGALNEAARNELERQGVFFGLESWFYRYLYRILPEDKRADYQKIYHARQAAALIGEHELKRLFGVFSENGLRFMPFKGADLAYRLYPDPSLRTFVDWDILFHPDDCARALDVLARDGWKAPVRHTDEHDAVMKTSSHHFSPHVRGQYTVEPHFTLSRFTDVDPLEIWAYTVECPDSPGRRVLSPEMNLLMLTRHASTSHYYHANLPKLLTDAAMILNREKPDFPLLRTMSSHWGLPYPGDLFAAFPEFFPPETIAAFGADAAKTARFRSMFELRGKLDRKKSVEIMLTSLMTGGLSPEGFWSQLRTCGPLGIRKRYFLPKHGAWGRLIQAYLHYFLTRTGDAVATLVHSDHDLRDYFRMVESLESDQKNGRKHKNA